MPDTVRDIYVRACSLPRQVPALVALPAAAELLQHAAEIRLGMYAHGGALAAHAQAIRLGFGAFKIVAVLMTTLLAVRFWRLGSIGRALRLGWTFWKGVAIIAVIQLGAETLALLAGRLIANGAAVTGPLRIGLVVAPLLAWLVVACMVQPWYVGLVAEDPAMTLRRSITGIAGQLWGCFGLLLAGVLPLMIVHYALGYGAMHAPAEIVWLMMLVDSGVVGLLAAAIASSYYALYTRAVAATGAPQSSPRASPNVTAAMRAATRPES